MAYIETKFQIRKRYAFLSIVVFVMFYFSNIANSQTNVFPVKEMAAESKEARKKGISPVKVAIIDSNFNGVDIVDFPGDIEAYDVISNSSNNVTKDIITQQGNILSENNNHGTKVLREFMEEYEFLRGEYQPNVLLVKISSKNDNKGKVGSVQITKGIEYAVNNGADVINISLGTLQKTKNVLKAIEYASSRGVIVVAASGNWGEDKKIDKKDMSVYAQSKGAIAVGAMDGDGKISTYTSGAGNSKLEFIAKPRFGSGTSLAAPIVSADVSVALEENQDMGEKSDINEIKKELSAKEKIRYLYIKEAKNLL
ncbi:MAG TPA: hypothetical protein DIC35_01715 [Candidatus Moranbacteria bacterium]|nr:hypothetical protein [Candidatus Moranbacteria bacterium]